MTLRQCQTVWRFSFERESGSGLQLERERGVEGESQCQEEWLGISLSHDSEAVSDCVEIFV